MKKRSSLVRRTALRASRKRTRIRIDVLDALASKAARLRDGAQCQRCGNRPEPRGLHAHHIVPRRYTGTRWDLDNLMSFCYGCHQFWHEHPQDFATWAAGKLGPDPFRWLWAKARAAVKVDRKTVKAHLKTLLAQMEAAA